MEYGQMMNEAKDNAKLAFYQNPGYQLEKEEKKIMIIDVEIGTDAKFFCFTSRSIINR